MLEGPAGTGKSRGVRRPGSPIAGLKQQAFGAGILASYGQKAWKPDCGIETTPIARLSRLRRTGQKAWKPDCGIET